ncbi:hypothetical protein [Thomasclavelia cocleata]|nr:hypothetical protein [Thomasclavelia cocleata]MCR1959895.1 hypothetical protein [Thomasclavelia cocleata]
MKMWLNRKRLASAVTIYLLHKRDYHIYLWQRYNGYYDFYYDCSWHWNDCIKINNNIKLCNIHAKTLAGLGSDYRQWFDISFDLYINDEFIRKYEASLSLNPSKSDFGCWEVKNVNPDKDKINKDIPQWAVYKIVVWVETTRNKYN